MIKDMREKHKNVLLLDCGDVFSKTKDLSELRAKISIRGLGLMKYDALNIADSDLVFGWDFLQEAAQKSNVPLLSANVIKQNLNQPLVQEYLVKKFAGFTVGIIGLASLDYFNKESLIKEGLVITDPEETLKRILSEIGSCTSACVYSKPIKGASNFLTIHFFASNMLIFPLK